MAVTIHWRPASDEGKAFEGGTSTSLEKLTRALGNHLDEGHIATLHAMTAASDDPFYEEVARVIQEVGAIQIWGTY